MREQQQTIKFKQRIPFSQIHNDLIESDQISGTAFKVWCYLFSRPENWTFYWSDILLKFKEGRTAVKAAAKELEALGYILREQQKVFTGRGKEWRWGGMEISVFYDPSQNSVFMANQHLRGSSPLTENPSSGDPSARDPMTGNEMTGNRSTRNTNISNTDINNTDINSSSSLPDLETAIKFAEEEDLKIDVKKWLKISRHEKLNNWKKAIIAWAENPKNRVSKEDAQTETNFKISPLTEIKMQLYRMCFTNESRFKDDVGILKQNHMGLELYPSEIFDVEKHSQFLRENKIQIK